MARPCHNGTDYQFLLCRHECFTGKYTTRKISYKLHPGPEWFIFHNLIREFIDDVISVFSSKICRRLRPLNFNYTFFKALLIFCHCRALFSSVLFLKIIVNNVLYCCTVNLSRHNYFLHWRIKIYYFIDVFLSI